MEFEIWQILILVAAAFAGGFIDAIAGGGGLICLPALLAVGIPPHLALGTNKLQGTFGTFSAALNFTLKGLVDPRKIALAIVCTLIGAFIGTRVVLLIDAKFLNYIIPVLLLALFIYTVLSPNLGESERAAKMSKNLFYVLFGLLLGFYDGFFGPGAGSFWTFALVGVLGLHMKTAVAQTKILNFVSNIVSLGVFIIGGQVLWMIGIIMGCAQIVGGWMGSNLVVKKDVKFVRTILLFVVACTILKLLYGLIFG
ncbi:TSUP family transporter [Campylobacter sp. VBCF_06 NA8]|uniref:TSUP family transporter n=1 Tax=unclassified Campylobacter TaxID=2593542 RepID=UPI001B524C47|nr:MULTISPECIES: TSUP family transporter [unclassified Campylobacter]MBP3224053.1 TSUP family transporter [Campylobacter sp.]MDA3046336.1 TSUP family transporter [Campylobacter sp. VBCF_06 NA8]MDA3047230.1 TSUP family transporter [Campylobacter sp. JMF_08 NE1]MDA3061709.1 TSUP family transporter [Campylobacter sp. JMF_14 EL1]MDA3073185.1 TSUP family transporter [Campylobacter sp. JMF_10 EL2]